MASRQKRSTKHKVFISWSGQRSHLIAQGWRQLLNDVLPQCEPFLSSHIAAGESWLSSLSDELNSTNLGITCLTPENLGAPWILIEAGASSKHVAGSRLCLFLFGLNASDLEPPLSKFQAQAADMDGAKKIIASVNESSGEDARAPDQVERSFNKFWPDFEKTLNEIPAHSKQLKRRSKRSIIEEVLALARADLRAMDRLQNDLIRSNILLLPDDTADDSPGPTKPKDEKVVTVEFVGGSFDGRRLVGSTIEDPHGERFQAATTLDFTKGRIGARVQMRSEESLALAGHTAGATMKQLTEIAPETYGAQVYELVEKDEKENKIDLKMKFVPRETWQAERQQKKTSASQP